MVSRFSTSEIPSSELCKSQTLLVPRLPRKSAYPTGHLEYSTDVTAVDEKKMSEDS